MREEGLFNTWFEAGWYSLRDFGRNRFSDTRGDRFEGGGLARLLGFSRLRCVRISEFVGWVCVDRDEDDGWKSLEFHYRGS